MKPKTTASILFALGYARFNCSEQEDGDIRVDWREQTTLPTDQQLTEYATDAMPLPGGQLFSDWLAENGGDETRTKRRLAAIRFAQADGNGIVLRAIIEDYARRMNYLTNRVIELQTTLDAIKASTGNVSSVRDAIPSTWLPTSTRNRVQTLSDIRQTIQDGQAD